MRAVSRVVTAGRRIRYPCVNPIARGTSVRGRPYGRAQQERARSRKEITMARLFALAVLFTSLFTINLAWADRGYRVVPITTDSGSTDVFAHDVNNRGE